MNADIKEYDSDQEDHSENQLSTLCTQEKLALSSWGLPENVLRHYAGKGITHMFKWQLECLTIGRVLEGGNLVFSAPTSAGKTLVAEILMAQTVFEKQKKVILILPFVSVVREKMFYLQSLFSLNGIRVEGYMGGHSPSVVFKQVHIAICTIEKANSIINRLLEEKDLNCLGLVVVDELHLLGDPYRGYLLELLLAKLKYMSSKMETNIQIVGMSATLPNLKVLADWLNADLYFSNYRPVPLSETLKCGTCMYDKHLTKIKEVTPIESDIPDCQDHIGQLCLETIKNGQSVLIFCPSKAWCENLAYEIALFFKRHGCSKSATINDSPGWIVRNQIDFEKVNQVMEHLKMTPVGMDGDLQKTVPYGVAFHHAGLTLDERDIIEGSFRNGSIKVLCATSTLSSGVNLPARRVIIRSPMAFGRIMDILTYRQMIGRAGRMGVDTEGESILICKESEKIICQNLMSSDLKPIESCLGCGPLSSSLKRALLEIIASGVASTPEEVQKYADCTFLASSSNHKIENPINSCITFLEENEFIRFQENKTIYVPTPLGQACLASSMPPDEGLSLFRELQRARRCFVLDTDLHIIYQVTPYSVSEQLGKLDWLHVLSVLENLSESMKRVGELIGVEDSFLVRIAKGTLNPNILENKIKISIHRRFYTALALQDLVNEVPLVEVAKKFNCNKGTLQSLQQSAATYAGMVTEFTRKLGWGSVELIFSQFQERLQFGVQRDLCELMRLPLLNVIRARTLYKAGYTNFVAIANASASDLETVLYSTIPFQTKKDILGETSFERLQRNKLETIWITGKADLSVREAAEILIEQARNALELEMGVEGAKWRNGINDTQSSNQSPNSICRDISEKQNHSSKVLDSNTLTKNIFSCTSSSETVVIKNLAPLLGDNIVVKENNLTKKENLIFSSSKRVRSLDENIKCEDLNRRQEEVISKQLSPVRFNTIQFISTPNEDNFKHFQSILSPNEIMKRKHGVSCFNSETPECQELCNMLGAKEDTEFTKKNETDYFASSLNVDTLNFSEALNEHATNDHDVKLGSYGKVEETDSCSSSSASSVQILYETSIISKEHETERISEDLFALQETETELNQKNFAKVKESELVQVAEDLFSESLTFDTQWQRTLEVNDADINEDVSRIKQSVSVNSDDLGFFSDVSPQKLNQVVKQKATSSNVSENTTPCQNLGSGICKLNVTHNLNSVTESNVKILEDNVLDKSQRQALKRKIGVSDSPDFIIGSDESLIEDSHVRKKAKFRISESKSSEPESCIFPGSVEISNQDGSDTEILPTPKFSISASNLEDRRKKRNKLVMERKRPTKCSKNSSGKRTNDTMISDGERFVEPEKLMNGTKTNVLPTQKVVEGKCNWLCKGINKLSSWKNWDKINIIDITTNTDLLESFHEELKTENILGFALACRRVTRERKNSIGVKITKSKSRKQNESGKFFQYKDMVLDGIAIYFRANDVFFLSFDSRHCHEEGKTKLLQDLIKEKKIFRLFDAKEQIKLLYHFTSIFLEGSYEDPQTAHWLLSKNWKAKVYSQVVVEYIPEATKLTSQLGPLLGFSGPGTCVKSSIHARTRACVEAFLTFHLIERQLKMLHRKSLLKLFQDVEMPLICGLAEMELNGFRFDRNKLIDIKNRLDSEQSKLSDKAYSFAQYKFCLTSPVAVSKLLYNDLKLAKGDSFLTKKKRPSTSKEALQVLAIETNHPLPDIILDWRKIQSIITKVLTPLLRVEEDTSRIFPITELRTTTGRLTMQEPNLQNIPRNFYVKFGNHNSDISVREIFVPSEGCTLLSADYCQMEMRLLAHLSGDEKLLENINNSTDIFVSIASHIYDVMECNVCDDLRQNAKKIFYGIIYGIGHRGLSHQLHIEEEVALTLMEDLKCKYKGVTRYLDKIVKESRKRGYVSSLMGRRRYLAHINDPNPAVKAEAERQAVNTTIQSSAADILKIAMVRIRQKIKGLNQDRVISNLLLHLHDELLFEVNNDCIETVASIVKETMENAVSLRVSTPVKLHIGSSWGQLRPYMI